MIQKHSAGVVRLLLALAFVMACSWAGASLLAVPGKTVPVPLAQQPASAPPSIAPVKLPPAAAPAARSATAAVAAVAVVANPGPVDRVEHAFAFDGQSPAAATLGVGVTEAGTVLVDLQWSGAPELRVGLRSAGQAAVPVQTLRGGKAQARFAISAEQVRQQPLWAVTVAGVPGVQGKLSVRYPKGQTQVVEQSVKQLREAQGNQGKRVRLDARPQLVSQVTATVQRPKTVAVAAATTRQGKLVTPTARAAVQPPSASLPALSGPVQVAQGTAVAAPQVRSVRAERGDVILPKTRIVIEGQGLAAGQKVHLIWPVHSGEDVLVAAQGPGSNALVVDLPDGAGFAAPVNVPMWVEGVGALMSNRVQFTLTPLRETLELDLRDFTNELMLDHWGFVLFEPTLRDPHWPLIDPAGSTKFSTLALPDAQTLSAAFQHKMVMIDAQRTSPLWYFGGKGDDEFLKNTTLKNGWVVQGVHFDSEGNSAFGGYGARLVEQRTGTPSLFVKVHWWYDAAGYVGYRVGYVIEGPKGVPYK